MVDDVSTTPATTIANLTNGTLIYLRVAAKNDAGAGSFGLAASAIPLPATVPGRPQISR